MTPKEKARNLAMKYWKLNYDWDGGTNDEWAKEGALIAVDEILDTIKWCIGDSQVEYWQEVKKEIELL
jgi:hypothetical protein